MVDPQETDLGPGKKNPIKLACAMVFPVWWVLAGPQVHNLALISAQ